LKIYRAATELFFFIV